MIIGYKAFNNDKTNRYNQIFEEGKSYYITGELKWGSHGNGYHFCLHMADVFRYFDNPLIGKVTSLGKILKYDDEYYGYYDMYVSEGIYINRFLTRKEIIDYFLKSQNYYELEHFLISFKLNKEELKEFSLKLKENNELKKYLDYYQKQELDAFTRELKKKD